MEKDSSSRLFPFPFLHLSLAFMLLILLNSPPTSSAYEEWFLNCKDSLNCESISTMEFPLYRSNGTENCGHPEPMKLNCEGSRRTTIEIFEAKFELLGFSSKDQIIMIAEMDFSDQFCWGDHKNSSISIYAIIPVSYDCRHSQSQIPDRANCFGTKFRYLPFENTTGGNNGDAFCVLSAVVPISPSWLLKELGDLQMLEQQMKAEFASEAKVDAQVCRNCSVYGGFCGYDLFLNQTRCYCQSPSNGFGICPSSLIAATHPPGSGKSHLLKRLLIIGTIALGSIILIISIIIIFIYNKRKRTSNKDEIEETIRKYSKQTPNRYSYSKLKKMTDSFKDKLGQGGFSTVYKGKLSDGRHVAVKLLNESNENGQEFINEVVSITGTSHVNIATLLGFCYERNKRALIYEYMPKGSLDKYIFHRSGLQKNDVELDWSTLYSIIMGVGRGLEYLHRGCNTRILHFDIKPHNILLDNNFCPKISDFGLAKQCKESHISMTGVKGTVGFIAPEVIFKNLGRVSHKSDVYSYGMLVLEMVGERKRPNEGVRESSEDEYFPDWIYKDLAGSEIDGGCMWGNTEEEEEMARKMIIVGLCCIQTLPEERPSMSDVVGMLEGSVDGLQIPPKPTMFAPPAAALPQLSSSFSSSTSYL